MTEMRTDSTGYHSTAATAPSGTEPARAGTLQNGNGTARHGASTTGVIRVLHTLPDLAMGGGQQVVVRTIAYLNANRFKNEVVYFGRCAGDDVASLLRKSGVEPRLFEYSGRPSLPSVVADLCAFIRERGIDVVHVQGTPVEALCAQGAARECGVPVVRTLHGVRGRGTSWSQVLRRPHPRTIGRKLQSIRLARQIRALDRDTIEHAVAVSDDAFRSWASYLSDCGIPKERTQVCYNGVPLDRYPFPLEEGRAAALRAELGLGNAYPVLINVGSLSHRKGQELLIELMKRLKGDWPDARLLLVGGGPDRPKLEATIRESGLTSSALLLGQRLDVPDLLAVSDVFVFATTGAFEGFPLVVLEAMAAGVPVVSVPYPSASMVIRDGENGRLVAERSAEALADAVADLAADRARLKSLGACARMTVERSFNLRKSVDRLQQVYESVVTHAEKSNHP